MSTATAIRPEIASAIAEVRFETAFPHHLEIVSSAGKSKIVPLEDGYGITVDDETTEDEIFELEGPLERLAATFDRIWPL